MRTSCKTYLLIVLLVALLVCPPPLLAAVIVVDGTCTLVDAISAANTDTATGSCPAGSGADEIELTVDVTLTEVNNTIDGPNGLPSIISEITVRSSDASPRTIERNSGASGFRIIHIGSIGTVNLERVVVRNGLSFSDGGAIFNRAQLALRNTTVSGSSAEDGGGIFNHDTGTLGLTNSAVSGNSATYYGGGIYNRSTVALIHSTVAGNSATFGGGGIYNGYYGSLTLNNSTVSGNSADTGGGIDNPFHGTLTMTNSTVSGNLATNGGGGITNSAAPASLINSTVSGNSANYGAGGIFNGSSGSLTLVNSTVSGNSAGYWGGGILNVSDSTLTLTNSTVSGNSATVTGGGLYNYYSSATLTGSLVGNSPSGGNCGGPSPVTDGGSNLADDTTCGSIPGWLSGLDPTLADNGGPTLTHALLPGSSAIDLAGDCGLATDQRLFLRHDGSCDSGSFEFGGLDPALIFIDGFESGDTSAWSATVP